MEKDKVIAGWCPWLTVTAGQFTGVFGSEGTRCEFTVGGVRGRQVRFGGGELRDCDTVFNS